MNCLLQHSNLLVFWQNTLECEVTTPFLNLVTKGHRNHSQLSSGGMSETKPEGEPFLLKGLAGQSLTRNLCDNQIELQHP